MNSNGNGKPEPADPENAVRMLELELMRQRATRQHGGAPYRGLRTVSLVFFFAVLLGALFAFYYVFVAGGLEDFRARNAAKPGPTVAPSSSSTP
jgi:hypothetical protein